MERGIRGWQDERRLARYLVAGGGVGEQSLCELSILDRFELDVVDSQPAEVSLEPRFDDTGQDNDRRSRVVFEKLAHQPVAMFARHAKVGDHQVERLPGDLLACFGSVGHGDAVPPALGEGAGGESPHQSVVIDHKGAVLHHTTPLG